jgi:hypothetical protein
MEGRKAPVWDWWWQNISPADMAGKSLWRAARRRELVSL